MDGAVRDPFTLSSEELRNIGSETRVATLECAGNGRVFLVPQVQGAQWELGAVSMRNGRACPCARCWSGPSLQKMFARSCSKERIAEYPKKSPFLPTRFRTFGVCPAPRPFSRKF